MAAFDRLDVDSFLQTLSYVHARGLARVACTGRLGAVVSHEAQQSPSLLVLRGTLDEVVRALPERLAARPTVAFVMHGQLGQGQNDNQQAQDMLAFVRNRLPPETEVLGACTESLHCLWNRTGAGGKAAAATELEACDGDDCVGLLLATLPEARAQAFHIDPSFLRNLNPGEDDASSSEADEWSSDDAAEEEDDAAYLARAEGEVPPPPPHTIDGYTAETQGTSSAVPTMTTECATEAEGACEGAAFLASLPSATAVSANDIQANASPLDELLAMDPPPQVVVVQVASQPGHLVDRIQAAFPQAAVIGGVSQETFHNADDALVLWLDYRRSDVYSTKVSPNERLNGAPSNGTLTVHPRRRLTSGSAASTNSLYAMAKRALPFLDAEVPTSPDAGFLDAGASFSAIGGSSDTVDAGQVAMVADGLALIIMTNTEQGSLYVQLLELMDRVKGPKYPRRHLDSGVKSARAAWDKWGPGPGPALILCWTAGAKEELGQPSRFVCARRQASWLIDVGVLEMGGQLALIVMISFIGVFCCVKHCNQAGRGRPFRRNGRVTDERGRQRRSAAQTRLRDLRSQLAEIPDEARERSVSMQEMDSSSVAAGNSESRNDVNPGSPGPVPFDVDQGSETSSASGGHQSWTSSRTIVDECSICQNEVVVRVVLRPCGHTACKKCVSRIVEMNPNSTAGSVCPFCRSNIDGVQTVYL